MRYKNPILPGFHPDPTICRVGEKFYLATSSFEYFPGAPLYRSENLVNWAPIGHALTRKSQLPLSGVESSEGIFAPTLRHHDEMFYLTATNVGNGGHFLITADDPTGEWSDPIYVDAPGIDPDLYFENGTCYFTYRADSSDRQIEQAELDPTTGELGPTETVWQGLEDPLAEAPHIYKHDDTYFLVVAEGGTHTGHMVVVARSDDPAGPFEPYPDNPILTHRGDVTHDIDATGHADFVEDADGNWWMVCLGIRQCGFFPGWHHLGRETFFAPILWENGWPIVNEGEIHTEVEADIPGKPPDDTDFSPIERTDTDYSDGQTQEWVWRRNPDRKRYAFTNKGLILTGSPETLNEKGTTLLCRRQTNFNCRVRADIVFDPKPGEEAGVTVLMNEKHHYSIGIVCGTGEEGSSRKAIVRLRIGDATQVVGSHPVDDRSTLGIDANRECYQFLVDGNKVASAATKYLSTEVAGGFTGVMVGPYATGNGKVCETTARIERFVYEPIESGKQRS